MGAGPSIALGGPSWTKLEDAVLEGFVPSERRAELKQRGWWDLLDFVCDTLEKRSEVENLVSEKLREASPEPWIDTLLQAPWRAIYTTNYDDVPERLNDLAQTGGARFTSYVGGRLPETLAPRERPIVKVMGDVRERHPSKAAMILSQSDRSVHPSSEAYRAAIQRLREEIDEGVNVVILGHSLEDRILLTLLQDLARWKGAKPDGQIFLVSIRPPRWDIALAVSKLNIRYVDCDAEALAAALAGVEGPVPAERSRQVLVKGKRVSLGAHVLKTVDSCGQLIDASFAGTAFKGPEDFLARSAYSRDAFKNQWDFKRTLHKLSRDGRATLGTGTVKDVVDQFLVPPRKARTIAFSGPPGTAKTMSALRVAHDWTVAGGIALYVDTRHHPPDGAFIADCVQSLQQDIIAQISLSADDAASCILVVLDNAGAEPRIIDRFRAACRTRSVTACNLLLTGKPPELAGYLPIFDVAWELSGKLTGSELTRLADYAKGMPHPPTAMEIDHVKLRGHELGFWGALYQLVEPSRKPLEESIVGFCNTLQPWERDISAYAACFETIGVPLPIAVVSRIVSTKTRSEIRKEIESGMIGQVVYVSRESDLDCIRFLNKPSAQTLSLSWRTARNPHQMVQSFIGSVAEGSNESQTVARWLIQGLAHREDEDDQGRDLLLSLSDREHLMGSFGDRFPSASALHHHGRLLRLRRKFEAALNRLEVALRQTDAYQDRGNIYHSIATTCARWARELNDADDRSAAAELLDRADDALTRAATDRPTYKYAIAAEIHLERARTFADSEQAKGHLWQAYELAKYAELFSRSERAVEVSTRLLQAVLLQLGSMTVTREEAKRLARDHRTAAGYHRLVATLLGEPPWSERPRTDLENAGSLLTEGHSLVPKDAMALHSLIRVRLALDPRDASILAALDLLEDLGMKDEALLMRAYFAATNFQARTMRQCQETLQQSYPGFHVPAGRRREFVIRTGAGPHLYEVRGGSPNWIQFADQHLPVPGWEVGEKVRIEILPTGVLPLPDQ